MKSKTHTQFRLLRTLGCLTLAFVLIAGCTTVPYTERSQFMMVSEAEETSLGAQAFAGIKANSRLNRNGRLNALIRRVGLRIARASGTEHLNWEFIVINEGKVNAFALPGGKVVFYTGILPFCEDEAGVAAVMGHEIAHVLARHGAERLSQSRMMGIGKAVLSVALSGSSPVARGAVLSAYGIGTNVGVMLPFSRSHESEADGIGLTLMSLTGYDPEAAVDFWKRMEAGSKGSKAPELLATHPGHEKRIERLEALLPAAKAVYNDVLANYPYLRRPPERISAGRR